jgi:hypothetical protein
VPKVSLFAEDMILYLKDPKTPRHHNQLQQYGKRCQKHTMENRPPLQQMLLENWLSACRKLKLHPCLPACTSINSKWIKDLNIRLKTLKLVQERAVNALEAIGIGKDFLNSTPATQQLRERMDKWDYIKLKSFCTTKEMVSKLKRPPTEWEKMFAGYTSDKGLISRIYRELKKLNSPKIN